MPRDVSALIVDAKRQAQLLRDLHRTTEADGGSPYYLYVAHTLERLIEELDGNGPDRVFSATAGSVRRQVARNGIGENPSSNGAVH